MFTKCFPEISEEKVNVNDGVGQNVLVGVFAEDVLDDNYGLLHHIIDLGLYEIQQCADAALC